MISKYVNVLGSALHYREMGSGDPIVFIHGIPTSSYLWREVMPLVATQGRCIALDLIGCGQSEKPNISYSVFDHIDYFDGFMQALKLDKVTFVMHAWGSVIGFDYAMRHPDKITGLVFLEAHLRAAHQIDMVTLPVQDRATVLRDPDGGYQAIMKDNVYIEKILPQGMIHRLSEEVMAEYRMPFHRPQSRKVIWQYLQDLPMGHRETCVSRLISAYSEKLQHCDIPKLLLYAMPGFNTSMDTVSWAREQLPKLTIVEIDEALHYAPESRPKEVANAIVHWYQQTLV